VPKSILVCLSLLVLALPQPGLRAEVASAPSLFGMGHGIDHAVLVVRDLEAARTHFAETLGFRMPPPGKTGRHPTGTKNVSSAFADISYLELLAVADPALVAEHRPHYLRYLEQHEGVRLFALSSSDVEASRAWLTERGFTTDPVAPGSIQYDGWQRDSSEPNWWTLRFSGDEPPADLPFFIRYRQRPYAEIQAEWDEGYAEERSEEDRRHPNGALGIAAIELAVADLDTVRATYLRMGLEPIAAAEGAAFRVGRRALLLRSAQHEGDRTARFLAARGAGVMALHIEVEDLSATRDWLAARLPADALDLQTEAVGVDASHAHGVRLVFVQEPEANRPKPSGAASSTAPASLSAEEAARAAGHYAQYCALCHGDERQGYAADNAPSLRSRSLLSTADGGFMYASIAYGRPGTAMAGYLDSQGGPMTGADIGQLLRWLWQQGGLSDDDVLELPGDPVEGDVALGASLYQRECAECHGAQGEGISAPALGNPMLLARASDSFLRYAIAEGRDGTPMPAYRDRLSAAQIDALTAFLRSRASGWEAPTVALRRAPTPAEYVLNPTGHTPEFTLRENRFVPAAEVVEAMSSGARMVLLDARAMSDWQRAHIPGAVPVPYYSQPDTFASDLPNDGTWIIAYCACPHAASGVVVDTLRRLGFPRTAIIDEGILVWTQRGYPIASGL